MGKVHSDKTGKFPIASSSGNKNFMVTSNHDSNAILSESLKSGSVLDHLQAIIKVNTFLNEKDIAPKFRIIDNECSDTFKHYMQNTKNASLLLVPSFSHRVNTSEKSIDMFKCYFIAGLSTVNPDFPLHLWFCILPLANVTLNFLRPSRINPVLSAHELLNGVFDCNKTTLVPPGTKLLFHGVATKRQT